MNDTRKRLLTEALGEKWHETQYMCHCDDNIDETCLLLSGEYYDCSYAEKLHEKGITNPVGNCGEWRKTTIKKNRTFAHADDYEALRVAVIVPNIEAFHLWLKAKVPQQWFSGFEWWLTMSPEERNEIICDFGIEVLGWGEEK